ncbi:MAG TPA: 50S ribosomal protein L6 [Kofleriaceae bacterium]|nr:50S ribosomal protein L6 [Kofleriaceae bacterium]
MSRVGKKPIPVPSGVQVSVSGSAISVKGPKGQLQMDLHPKVKVTQEGSELVCTRDSDDRESRAAHGLVRAHLANMVQGVSAGFQRKLEINGVGYRAEVSGKKLVLQLGYSHPINYDLPDGVTAAVDKNVVVLSGIDKQLLGATAAKVRSFRPPEPYKGKGVKYAEETILRKVGKAAG